MNKKYATPEDMAILKKKFELLDKQIWSKNCGMSYGVLIHKLNSKSTTSTEQYNRINKSINKTIDRQIKALDKIRIK